MEPKVVVMITILSLPGAGDSNVHVQQFETAARCMAAASIEASDPFVQHVECAALDDGVLKLQFKAMQKSGGNGAAPKPRNSSRRNGPSS